MIRTFTAMMFLLLGGCSYQPTIYQSDGYYHDEYGDAPIGGYYDGDEYYSSDDSYSSDYSDHYRDDEYYRDDDYYYSDRVVVDERWEEESFDRVLASHGEWVTHSTHGRVWRPRGVATHWRPYSHGYWSWRNDAWFWNSFYPWGRIVFHYGRWDHDRGLGWVWVADRHWGPAWVSWRSSGDWIGWAPLPPRRYHTSTIDHHHYHFIHHQYLGERELSRHLRPGDRSLFAGTRPIDRPPPRQREEPRRDVSRPGTPPQLGGPGLGRPPSSGLPVKELPAKEPPVRNPPVRELPVREPPVRELPAKEPPSRQQRPVFGGDSRPPPRPSGEEREVLRPRPQPKEPPEERRVRPTHPGAASTTVPAEERRVRPTHPGAPLAPPARREPVRQPPAAHSPRPSGSQDEPPMRSKTAPASSGEPTQQRLTPQQLLRRLQGQEEERSGDEPSILDPALQRLRERRER